MNELTRTVKARILDEFSKHPYLRFGEHNDLVALSCDAEFFAETKKTPKIWNCPRLFSWSKSNG